MNATLSPIASLVSAPAAPSTTAASATDAFAITVPGFDAASTAPMALSSETARPFVYWLRAEGAAVFSAACTLWAWADLGSGWTFAALFLVPDLAMLGYLVSRRVGAWSYNLAHSYVPIALLTALGLALHVPHTLALAVIWTAHVGFDRMMGYGLKSAEGFGVTHLGRLGRRGAAV
jgi:hypothetical protein